jgi:hypothetical protein
MFLYVMREAIPYGSQKEKMTIFFLVFLTAIKNEQSRLPEGTERPYLHFLFVLSEIRYF